MGLTTATHLKCRTFVPEPEIEYENYYCVVHLIFFVFHRFLVGKKDEEPIRMTTKSQDSAQSRARARIYRSSPKAAVASRYTPTTTTTTTITFTFVLFCLYQVYNSSFYLVKSILQHYTTKQKNNYSSCPMIVPLPSLVLMDTCCR